MKYNDSEFSDNKMIDLIVSDRYKILRHSVLSIGLLFLISGSREVSDFPGNYGYYRLLSVYGILVLLCYTNMYLLVPVFFFKGKYIIYLFLLVLLVLLSLFLVSFLLDRMAIANGWEKHSKNVYGERGFYEGTIIVIPIILVTTMIKLFQSWVRDRMSIAELRNITLKMELNELRNQINPHFLFNMLNGIKALVRTDPIKATTVIMKLSEFLRYQLYENNDQKIMLRSEMNFLSNFLDLEKLRRDNFSIKISSSTPTPLLNSVFLPSNLFTTFVENAVKHSVDIGGNESYVRITIDIRENRLWFSCKNSRDPNYKPSDEKSNGLGLANIRRRLELLYSENFKLDFYANEQEYSVTLSFDI